MSDADSLAGLNKHFGISDELSFRKGPGGLIFAEIDNVHARATLALRGAQILGWNPKGQQAVIWLSPEAQFEAEQAIRGGIPICWPWFGNHAGRADFPAHGYARTAPWEILETARLENGDTQLKLKLLNDHASHELWPHQTPLEVRVSIGEALSIEVVTLNLGPVPVTIEQALHAYFAVGDVRKVRLLGLGDRSYIDKLDQDRFKTQAGDLTFTGEVDRVYLDAGGDCLLEDPVLRRRIRIAKRGSHATVVWNPWEAKAAQLGDFPANGHLEMLCIESANTERDSVTLGLHEEHRLSVRYTVESLD
ncbi:D-hexose-6-phosphate mutarotase [Methylococcus sp. EFPC2]|uniref:D-hexose-6-phosphate mutarotase n=1 Tax=Methylococcus sp. EFPC2 TaxID=2812648 RepID=UPI001967DA4F|nr:D-hexose-6-phosphate mutarotase [Methylococcus sp. EFPC2]QSA98679.1 D-hexose-6-phosphate mutarotase [Methylococcus sp. EFPC2]